MAIWIVQFVNRVIHVLDYIEGVGQPLSYYAHELRKRGWKDAVIYLPHDGVATNNVTGKRYMDHWSEAGFDVAMPIFGYMAISYEEPPPDRSGGGKDRHRQAEKPPRGSFWSA